MTRNLDNGRQRAQLQEAKSRDQRRLSHSEQEHVTLSNEARGLVISTNTGDCSVPERKQTIINVKQFTRSDANISGPLRSSLQFLPFRFLPRTLTSTFAFVFPTLPHWMGQGLSSQQGIYILFGTNAGCSTDDWISCCNKRLLTSVSMRAVLGVTHHSWCQLFAPWIFSPAGSSVCFHFKDGNQQLSFFQSSICFCPD